MAQNQDSVSEWGDMSIHRIMCLSGATCLSTECYFSELALKNPTKHVGLVQSGPHHHLIENELVLAMI